MKEGRSVPESLFVRKLEINLVERQAIDRRALVTDVLHLHEGRDATLCVKVGVARARRNDESHELLGRVAFIRIHWGLTSL